MTLKRLMMTTAAGTLAALFAAPALAQVTIDDDRTAPVDTESTGDDITISTTGSVTVTDGAAVTINSDNNVIHNGTITTEDSNNTTGILIEGGNTGSLVVGGAINLTEDFTPTDDDSSGTIDGPFAEGTGRTGILISGASPFVGDVSTVTGSSISIEGNDSYGLQLAESAGLTGDVNLAGTISVLGTNGVGVDLAGEVIGNLATGGSIAMRGEGAQAIRTTGGIDGAFTNSASISNTGYRFEQRPNLTGRNLLDGEDLLQAGSAVEVGGDITGGIFLQQVRTPVVDADGEPVLDDDGNPLTTLTAASNISQLGSAPAILINGDGTPIAIGRVGTVTDPMDDDFDAALQYAFVNQGTLAAAGVYDDVNATAFEVRDAALTDGISNSGTMTAATFRSGLEGADTGGNTGFARVIVIGSGAIADQINNSGIIIASVSEAGDEIYADRANIISPRALTATAIDIDASADLSSITNTGSISAVLLGRLGTAVAIRDASGTLIEINNSGAITALGSTSDSIDVEATDFNLVAIDVSANTTGVTLTQTTANDDDPDDDITPPAPAISGDVFFGSGADVFNVSSGTVGGEVAFGAGADSFALSGGAAYVGALSDSDGNLTVSVTDGSSLTNTSTEVLNVTSATFDGTSTFAPTLDGATGNASALVASGDITFGDGATIAPVLANVVNVSSTNFTIADAGNLVLEGDLNGLNTGNSPFLYNTTYALDPNDSNVLVVTLDLRSTDELGLDAVQASTFTSAFEALQSNSGLANALVNIQDGTEFNQAYNQLLPEFAAAGRQFVIANVDGAVGAVGSHLDSARRSQEKKGGAWLQQFTYFADRDLAGLSEQYRGHGFGFVGGLDTALGPFHTVGVNFGFASTEIEDVVGVDEPLDVVTLQAGLYAGYASGGLGIEAYGGGGYNDFESNRRVSIDSFSSEASGEWSGTHYNGTLRAGYELPISKRFWARPTVSLDYLSLTEKAYTEEGDLGVALDIDKRTSDSAAVTAMFNLGARFEGRRTWIRPAIRAGYRNELINDGVFTTGRFAGLTTPFEIESEEFPNNGFLLGFSIAAGSAYSSFGLDFDSDIRDGFIRHTGRVVVRLLF